MRNMHAPAHIKIQGAFNFGKMDHKEFERA